MIADELNTEAEETTAATTDTIAASQGTTETAKATETVTDKGEGDKAVKTIATGADTEAEEVAGEKKAAEKAVDRTAEIKAMRESLAKHASAGDKKAYDKELKRMERLGIEKPEQIYGLWRELERWRDEGNLIKVPGKDAKPEDKAAFNKAMNVPEKPEGYMEHIKLENGAVIGEADKPNLQSFLGAAHEAGAPPNVTNRLVNWYYAQQEEAAAKLDEDDHTFRVESERAMKEELGPALKRHINALPSLFADAPGGTDLKNEKGVMRRLLGGRTEDGRKIGDDPDIMRWMFGRLDPIMTVTEDGAGGAKAVETELAEIQALRKTDHKKYWSDSVQARELELITALEKNRAKA